MAQTDTLQLNWFPQQRYCMSMSPITPHEESADQAEATIIRQRSIHFILLHSEFTAFMYLEDVVRLSLSSRRWLICEVVYRALDEIKWTVEIYHEAMIDTAAAEISMDDYASSIHTSAYMCLSCGYRPAVSWLGYDECAVCFDEH